MLRYYIKVAWHRLLRSGKYTFINIAGLTAGMAGAMFILLWASHEYSYERFFKNAERIYQIWIQAPVEGKTASYAYTQEPLAPALKAAFPEIRDATRYMINGQTLIAQHEKRINRQTCFIDSSFFHIFNFPVLKGSTAAFFKNPHSIIINGLLANRISP